MTRGAFHACKKAQSQDSVRHHSRDVTRDRVWPAGVARPAIRALENAGYTKVEQLAGVREADLLALHGMGPKALGALRAALKVRGKRLR
jgi:hypothetical protein